jgi:hypothetical protein
MNDFKIFCYFIYDPIEHRIKIGQSTTPRQRIAQLENEAGHQLVVLAIIEDRLPLEQVMHTLFADYKISGDWFIADPALFQHINGLHFAAADNESAYPREYPEHAPLEHVECPVCSKMFTHTSLSAAKRALRAHAGRKHSNGYIKQPIPEVEERNRHG